MTEGKANSLALVALARGREISEKIKKGEAFKLKRNAYACKKKTLRKCS